MNIKEWSEDERPRERVISHGVENVSNAELLAILVGSGTTDVNSVEMMRQILADNGNSLRMVGKLTREQLEEYNGIGTAKAVVLQAAMEIGKRLIREKIMEKVSVSDADTLYDYFRSHVMDLGYEECHALYLDRKNQIVSQRLISRGGISEASVDVRIILKYALIVGASSVVLAHNHPSGNYRPSIEDDRLTEKVSRGCRAVGLRLMDHLIIGSDGYYSYYEENRL